MSARARLHGGVADREAMITPREAEMLREALGSLDDASGSCCVTLLIAIMTGDINAECPASVYGCHIDGLVQEARGTKYERDQAIESTSRSAPTPRAPRRSSPRRPPPRAPGAATSA